MDSHTDHLGYYLFTDLRWHNYRLSNRHDRTNAPAANIADLVDIHRDLNMEKQEADQAKAGNPWHAPVTFPSADEFCCFCNRFSSLRDNHDFRVLASNSNTLSEQLWINSNTNTIPSYCRF